MAKEATDPNLLARYSPGGDIYENIADQYGQAGADSAFVAFKKDGRPGVTEVLKTLNYGPDLETSTAAIFADQIKTDPFGAPLASANKILSTITSSAIFGVLKNPMVLVALVVLALVYFPNFRKAASEALKKAKK